MIRVEHGDMRDVLPRLVAEGIVADAVVTDPPYGLEFMGKEWDRFGGKPTMSGTELADHMHDASSPGEKPEFESRRRRDAPQAVRAYQEFSEAWSLAVWDVLKPGGYLLVFGGTRTHHRLWCAIEDAGFVIQDMILYLYGTGFPKGKTTQLKPAFEPIAVAYKPGGKRTLQIDECRIETVGSNFLNLGDRPYVPVGNGRDGQASAERRYTEHGATSFGLKPGRRIKESRRTLQAGRWPANVIHDGSDEVMEAFAAFGDAPGQSGSVTGKEPSTHHRTSLALYNARTPFGPRGDTGTAARFFYSAKAGAQDRWGSRHPTVKPVELIKYLVRLVCSPGGWFIDPFAGSGTAAVAALATGRNAVLVEQDAGYVADIRERLAFYEGEGRHSLVARNRNGREAAGTLL